MTLIVGIETDRGAWIGADSFIGAGGGRDAFKRGKVHRIGLCTVAFAGDFARAQWLRDHLRLDERPLRLPVDRWLRARFRAALKGAPEDASDDEEGVDALVVVGGEVWTIDEHSVTMRSAHGYAAVGVAPDAALAALHATHDLAPRARITRVMRAVAAHAECVSAPWDIRFVEAA